MRIKLAIAAIALVGLVLAGGWSAWAEEPSAEYQPGFELGLSKGREDAQFLPVCFWSFLFPLPGLLFTHLVSPERPTVSALLLVEDRSADYKAGFLDGYRKGKWKRRKEIAGLCAAGGALINALTIVWIAQQSRY